MEITIGKYTLESLTTGMYKDPFILYREYIQNSTDSIDKAVQRGVIAKGEEFIKVIVDHVENQIIIEDNGMGIKNESAYKVLTDIGNSKKRHTNHKGFRGIGRLGGISYCEKLIFETSYLNEGLKTIVEFDSNRLKELLIPGAYEDYTMVDVIKEITTKKTDTEDKNKHYFKVILKGVSTKYKLLDSDKVINYLSQVAPIPFNKRFKLADKINNMLKELSLQNDEYNLYFGKTQDELKPIFKPYKRKFYADISKKIEDIIEDINFKVIKNDYLDKTVAVIWYGRSKLLGTILDEKVKGLRVRKSGILIGDRFLLNDMFKEERFNGWIQGEVLVFDDNIIPNARRDDFEKNDEYLFLMDSIKQVAAEITVEIREASKLRNQKKNDVAEIEIFDNDSVNNKYNEPAPIMVKAETLEDELEMLFDQLDKKEKNNDILEKIEEILREEISENKIRTIIEKIRGVMEYKK